MKIVSKVLSRLIDVLLIMKSVVFYPCFTELSSLYIFLARNNATLTALQEAMKAYLLVKGNVVSQLAGANTLRHVFTFAHFF